MDMVAASGAGAGVPAAENRTRGASGGVVVRDGDRKGRAHAVVGCVALFVGWPVSVVVGGFFKNIRVHVGVGVGVLGFLAVAFGLGIGVSGEFVRVSLAVSFFIFFFPIHWLRVFPPCMVSCSGECG